MAVSVQKYNLLASLMAAGQIDLVHMPVTLALVDSAYVFDAAHAGWGDASAHEIAGAGYVAGGVALTGVAVSEAGGVASVDADDVTWAGLNATFRAAILYINDVVDIYVNPVLAYILFDDTPNDIVINGVNFSVIWPVGGFLTLG